MDVLGNGASSAAIDATKGEDVDVQDIALSIAGGKVAGSFLKNKAVKAIDTKMEKPRGVRRYLNKNKRKKEKRAHSLKNDINKGVSGSTAESAGNVVVSRGGLTLSNELQESESRDEQ